MPPRSLGENPLKSFGCLVRATGLAPNHLAATFEVRRDTLTDFMSGRREPFPALRHYVEGIARLIDEQTISGVAAVQAGREFVIGMLIDPAVSEMIAGRIIARIPGGVAIAEGSRIIVYREHVAA